MEELSVFLCLIFVNLNVNSHMRVEATILVSAGLEVGWTDIGSLLLYLSSFPFLRFFPLSSSSYCKFIPYIYAKVTQAT